MKITSRTAFDKPEHISNIAGQNRFGQWVPVIPEPYTLLIRSRCNCGKKFWSYDAYRAHYALVHILGL